MLLPKRRSGRRTGWDGVGVEPLHLMSRAACFLSQPNMLTPMGKVNAMQSRLIASIRMKRFLTSFAEESLSGDGRTIEPALITDCLVTLAYLGCQCQIYTELLQSVVVVMMSSILPRTAPQGDHYTLRATRPGLPGRPLESAAVAFMGGGRNFCSGWALLRR
jgi:hypothetical protein